MSQSVRFIHSDSHRACVGCATAKTKCVPSSDGTTTCERCTRLKKECVIVPRPDRKRKRNSGRQAALEEKVDEIVALLEHETKRRDPPAAGRKASPPQAIAAKAVAPKAKASPAKTVPFPDLDISDKDCEEAVERFITDQSVHSPWVDIPKGTTASSLREQKPLLFLAIMLASSYHDLEVQQRIAKIALQYISDQLIIRGNKSMALLQGLLVLLNWYQSQFLNPQATVTNLLHLSIALTTDLGLNQNPASLANQRLLHQSIVGVMNGARKPGPMHGAMGGNGIDRKTMEDRRALLGCFYIVMGITFHSSPTFSHAMGWSPQLEEAARVLTESGLAGNITDLRLAKMARLQQIVAEIDHLQRELTLADKPLASLSLYIQPFETRLEQFWAEMPADFRQDNTFLLAYHAAYRNLYKISLLDIGRPSPSSGHPGASTTSSATPVPSFTSAPTPAIPSLDSTLSTIALNETRHRCLRSACACMDCFFAVPPSKLFAMPLVFYAHVGLSMITLARLNFCVPSPWTPDLPPMHEILDRLARNLDQAMDASEREERKPFSNKKLAQWAAWIRILEGAVTAGLDGGAGVGGEDVTVVGDGDVPSGVPNGIPAGAAGQIAAMMSAAAAAGVGANAGSLYSTPPLEGGTGAEAALAAVSDAELLETDWSALLDDMCGYGLFGYSDDGVLQGVLNGSGGLNGFDGSVTM